MARPHRPRPPRPDDGARRRHRSARLGATAVILGLLVIASTALALTGHGTRRDPRASGRPAADGARTAGTAAAPVPAAAAPSAPPVTVRLRIARRVQGRRVAPGFLGVSLEYWGLADDEAHPRAFERVLRLLHAPGTGPMTLRIGGNSSEVTFLERPHRRLPRWAYGVGGGWIRRTARLVRVDHLRVIADLNEATATPRQAGALALALARGLPRRRLIGFELGNEPDGYARSLWGPRLEATPALARLARTQASAAEYAAEWGAYAHALRGDGDRPALIGPVLAKPRLDVRWVRALLAAPHPGLDAISVHEYPYSACAPPDSSASPTIARLLSARALRVMASVIRPAAALAHRAHLPLRVTEFNSVTCGGRPGVSDSFATALWAPGALFEMLSAGARSAFLHARSVPANSPFHWTAAGLDAQPLLYGLLLFTRALGPGARLEPVHLRAAGPAAVSAWAIRLRSGAEHLVVVDRGARPLRLVLPGGTGRRGGRRRRVAVQRLLAASARSTGGVTLAGQHLNGRARWVGRRIVTRIAARSGRVVVGVPAASAVLVSIPGR